jgi:hypothetical protein
MSKGHRPWEILIPDDYSLQIGFAIAMSVPLSKGTY